MGSDVASANKDLTLGAAPPAEREVRTPLADVRFALVLYGGVSLAIYIYGVVLEFLRLVQASEGEENAWSPLLDDANVTASVDIVSGTSAGGINGVLLGKALARGTDLDLVRSIWVHDADLERLLQRPGEAEPRSLLDTDRFERLIAKGLNALDPPDGLSPKQLASVFDLFVSGTRLRPWQRQYRTDLGGALETRQYRKQFHLKIRRAAYNPAAPELGYDRNDFTASSNPVLAQVARATSAFPGAFEPREIKRSDDPDGRLFESGEPDQAYFSDGGILHNKPFTEAITAILGRASDTPVRRWLVSVEPDPEARAAVPGGAPEADEVISKAVFAIPRYQSIGGDLERLQSHRRWVERQRELMADVERSLRQKLDLDPGSGRWVVGTQIVDAGLHQLERDAQFCADFAHQIAQAAALGEAAERTVEEALKAAMSQALLPREADFSFERRRVLFLLKRLSDELTPRDPQTKSQEVIPERREFMRLLWAEYDRISDLLWRSLQGEGPVIDQMARLDRERLNSVAYELAGRLAGKLAAGLAEIQGRTEALCAKLDALVGVELADDGLPTRLSYLETRHNYEAWDGFLLPLDPVLGTARDEVYLARISPEDAGFIDKPAAEKLAGDSLGHFSGFLKKEWRKNDILWGRLDAAELIVRMVGAKLPAERQEEHIERVQREVVKRELPDAPEDYRAYLESDDYSVGSETLRDVEARKLANVVVDSTGITRNMFATLQGAKGRPKPLLTVYKWVGRGLGWIAAAVRWPVRAIFGSEPALLRGADLTVLFATLWSLITLALAVLDQIDPDTTLWTLIVAGLLLFVLWTAIRSVAPLRRLWERLRRTPTGAREEGSQRPAR